MISKLNNFASLIPLRSWVEKKTIAIVKIGLESLPKIGVINNDPFRLFPGGPKSFVEDITAKEALSSTLGTCAPMVVYHLASQALFTYGIPAEKMSSLALLIFPWWSNSYFGEWLCVDFACSSVKKNRIIEKIPHRELSGISAARSHHSWCFYFCAALLFATYAYIANARVPATTILLDRHGETAKELAKDVLIKGSENFDPKYENPF